MKKEILFLPVALFISLLSFAQKTEKTDNKAPISIYTFNSLEKDVNSFTSIRNRLNLISFKFVIIDANDIDTNTVSLDFKNIGTTPTLFIYDDYNRYQNNNLLKGFLYKNDPTRWNLHCIENRIQPYFLNKE